MQWFEEFLIIIAQIGIKMNGFFIRCRSQKMVPKKIELLKSNPQVEFSFQADTKSFSISQQSKVFVSRVNCCN